MKWQENEPLLRRFLELYFFHDLKATELFSILEREFDLELPQVYHSWRFASSLAWGIQDTTQQKQPELYNKYFDDPRRKELKTLRRANEREERLRIPDDLDEFVEWLPSYCDSVDRRLKRYRKSRIHH